MLYILNMEQKHNLYETNVEQMREGEEDETVNEIKRTERRTGDG